MSGTDASERTGSAAHGRLTDQTLVAVRLAQAVAGGAAGLAAAHLLVGLATEPDGAAGAELRAGGLATTLPARLAAVPSMPGRPLLEAAAGAVRSRPTWTHELLGVVVERGGAALQDALAGAGYDLLRLTVPPPTLLSLHEETDRGPALAAAAAVTVAETFGLMAYRGRLTAGADLALARARALGGSARDLLLALVLPTGDDSARIDHDDDIAAAAAARATGDADAALEAACALARRAGRPVTTLDLALGAELVLAGGH